MLTFNYTVDDEPQSTTEHQLTPVQILANAGLDPNANYLVQIEGQHRVSYQENPNQAIRMHERMRFVSVSLAPTPVS